MPVWKYLWRPPGCPASRFYAPGKASPHYRSHTRCRPTSVRWGRRCTWAAWGRQPRILNTGPAYGLLEPAEANGPSSANQSEWSSKTKRQKKINSTFLMMNHFLFVFVFSRVLGKMSTKLKFLWQNIKAKIFLDLNLKKSKRTQKIISKHRERWVIRLYLLRMVLLISLTEKKPPNLTWEFSVLV